MNIITGLPRPAKKNELVGLDIELYQADKKRLHRPTGAFAVLSMAFENNDVYQITDIADISKALKRLDDAKWVLMNAAFDIFHLRRWADVPQRRLIDVMLIERDMFGGWYDSFALDDLCRRWLGKKLNKEPRDLFFDRHRMTKPMTVYAATDALTAVQVAKKQIAYLEEIDDDLACYWEIDEPALWAILDMPGVKVDKDKWIELGIKARTMADGIQKELGFNPGATNDCRDVIRDITGRLGRRVGTTKTGKARTDNETLENLLVIAGQRNASKEVALLSSILEYRTYSKAASTYGERWVEEHVEADGLVYPSWHVVGAETGRMSCSSPNLQQIPVRKMPEYRKTFIPRYDKILKVDVSQQEPRITAYLSQDRALVDAVMKGDVYTPIAKALNTTRDRAKVIFLGSTYGLTPQGMAQQEKIPVDEAENFFNRFFTKYGGVRLWMEKSSRRAFSLNYVTTPIGRRRWINPYSKQWQNDAYNGPIQGGAADQTKYALGLIHKETKARGLPFLITMVIHDEVVADLPEELMKEYTDIINRAWADAGEYVTPGIPTSVDIKGGASWGG